MQKRKTWGLQWTCPLRFQHNRQRKDHAKSHRHEASECQGQREAPKSFDGPRIKHGTANKGSQVRLASPHRTTMLMAKRQWNDTSQFLSENYFQPWCSFLNLTHSSVKWKEYENNNNIKTERDTYRDTSSQKIYRPSSLSQKATGNMLHQHGEVSQERGIPETRESNPLEKREGVVQRGKTSGGGQKADGKCLRWMYWKHKENANGKKRKKKRNYLF